jgi:hypothetical protein
MSIARTGRPQLVSGAMRALTVACVTALAATALLHTPPAQASVGVGKIVLLGTTVTLRDGRKDDLVHARLYDYREQRLARAPDYWRLTVRMDVRLSGRKPLPFRGTVAPMRDAGRPGGHMSPNPAAPVLLAPGRLYRLTVALTVSNFNYGQGIGWIEYRPGFSFWPGPRDRALWLLGGLTDSGADNP